MHWMKIIVADIVFAVNLFVFCGSGVNNLSGHEPMLSTDCKLRQLILGIDRDRADGYINLI